MNGLKTCYMMDFFRFYSNSLTYAITQTSIIFMNVYVEPLMGFVFCPCWFVSKLRAFSKDHIIGQCAILSAFLAGFINGPHRNILNFDLRININGLFEFVVKQKEFDM